MALTYDGSNGLFTRLGALVFMMDAVRTHQLNLKTLLANVQTEYSSTDAYMIEVLAGNIERRIAEAGGVLNDVRAAAEASQAAAQVGRGVEGRRSDKRPARGLRLADAGEQKMFDEPGGGIAGDKHPAVGRSGEVQRVDGAHLGGGRRLFVHQPEHAAVQGGVDEQFRVAEFPGRRRRCGDDRAQRRERK
jgi:hypothetical protein